MKDLSRRRKLHRRIRVGLALFWTVAVGVMFWNMQAKGVGESVLQSDGSVRVTRSEGLIRFDPVAAPAGAALLFYPGALVDPVAYAPMARAVAANGLQVVIQELPFRIAPLDGHKREVSERSVALMRAQPELSWVIGGHSRGAVLATSFAEEHQQLTDGLLIVGSSHPRETDLSGLQMDVTKIFASEDGLASEGEVRQFAVNLPDATQWGRVDGGNHAQFAYYGWQLGDGRALISRQAQHDIMVEHITAQLRRVATAH